MCKVKWPLQICVMSQRRLSFRDSCRRRGIDLEIWTNFPAFQCLWWIDLQTGKITTQTRSKPRIGRPIRQFSLPTCKVHWCIRREMTLSGQLCNLLPIIWSIWRAGCQLWKVSELEIPRKATTILNEITCRRPITPIRWIRHKSWKLKSWWHPLKITQVHSTTQCWLICNKKVGWTKHRRQLMEIEEKKGNQRCRQQLKIKKMGKSMGWWVRYRRRWKTNYFRTRIASQWSRPPPTWNV